MGEEVLETVCTKENRAENRAQYLWSCWRKKEENAKRNEAGDKPKKEQIAQWPFLMISNTKGKQIK